MTARPLSVIIPQNSLRRSPMQRPRKIIAYIATSADGFIARPDGDVAWLDRPRPKGHYGMPAFFKSIDTILWGRKTYAKGLEMGMEQGMKAVRFGPQIKNYVFSRRPRTFFHGPFHLDFFASTTDACRETFFSGAFQLLTLNSRHLAGGEIIASFLDQGEIDEFRINVIPIPVAQPSGCAHLTLFFLPSFVV